MKKYVLLILLISGCSQNDDGYFGPELYKGTWHLKEVLADPGDGSGTYRPVDSEMYLTFHRDGTFLVTEPLCAGAEAMGTYDQTQLNPQGCAYPLQYEHVKNTLIVYPPCIEPCGLKFIRK